MNEKLQIIHSENTNVCKGTYTTEEKVKFSFRIVFVYSRYKEINGFITVNITIKIMDPNYVFKQIYLSLFCTEL